MVSLHTYFDAIFCVSIPQREKLYKSLFDKVYSLGGTLSKYFVKPLNYQDSDISKYDYVDVEPPTAWTGRNSQSYNYMMCFFNIIEKCKKDGIKTLLYLEDDVCFLPHFNIFLPVIMNNIHPKWEMVYFGPGHHDEIKFLPSKNYKIETPYLYRSELNLGMQAVAIHERMYDMLLNLKNKPWLHENPYIDITIAHQFHRGLSEYGKRLCFGAFPYLVCESSGLSYNERNDVKRPEYELWKGQLNDIFKN